MSHSAKTKKKNIFPPRNIKDTISYASDTLQGSRMTNKRQHIHPPPFPPHSRKPKEEKIACNAMSPQAALAGPHIPGPMSYSRVQLEANREPSDKRTGTTP